MAINFDFKNKENKQKIMIGVLIAVIAITVVVLYTYFFKSQNVIPLSMEEVPTEPLIAVQPKSLDTEILSNPVFQGLIKFGDYPVDVKDSDLGRENPFIPF